MSIIALLENPIILGALVFLITLVLRKLGWGKDGVPALRLTMGVAVAIALGEWLLLGGPYKIMVCTPIWADPFAPLGCLVRIVEAISKEFGVVFGFSQIVYQILRREIAGRSLLGKHI